MSNRVGLSLEASVDSFTMDIYSFRGLAATAQLDISFKQPKHANKDCRAESLFPLLFSLFRCYLTQHR